MKAPVLALLLLLQPELHPGSLRLQNQGISLRLPEQQQLPYAPGTRKLRSQYRQDLHIFSELCQGRSEDQVPALRLLRIHRLHRSRYIS